MAIEEIEIEGYVGQNPKYTSEKYPDMLTFSVGVNQSFKSKDSDTREYKTTWYDVVSYDKNKSSFLATKLFKGDKVVVKGKPAIKTWIAKDGKTNATISIVLSKIALMNKDTDNKDIASITEGLPMPATNYNPSYIDDYYKDSPIKIPKHHLPILEDEIPF